MCTPTNDPFTKSFYSPEKGFTRLRSPTPQSGNVVGVNLARPSSAPPILITLSSAISAVDSAMPITGKITFSRLPPSEHQLLIETKLQAIELGSPRRGRLSIRNKLLLSPLACIHSNLYCSSLVTLIQASWVLAHLPLRWLLLPWIQGWSQWILKWMLLVR